jgi:hypothetical protein
MRFSVNARHLGSFWRDLLDIFVYGEQHHFTQIETHRATAADTSQYQQKKGENSVDEDDTTGWRDLADNIAAAHRHSHSLAANIRRRQFFCFDQWEGSWDDGTRLGQVIGIFDFRMACMGLFARALEPGGHSFVMTDDDTASLASLFS